MREPSAALLKATLINSTRKLPGADAVADFDVVPNMHQGFGADPHAERVSRIRSIRS